MNGLESEPQAPFVAKDSDGKDEFQRAIIDQLIADTELYSTAERQQELLDFVVRFRRMAPFNAMLLHIQRPGVSYVASVRDWREHFERKPKQDARPLLIMRPFGPVDLVYDVQDTEGRPLPESAFAFPATGAVTDQWLTDASTRLARLDIHCASVDKGDLQAGYVQVTKRRDSKLLRHVYRLALNRNHRAPTRFVTLAHELGHLLLGHLGDDPKRQVRDRSAKSQEVKEVEAETVAYLVARRHGVNPRSESYLQAYRGSFADMDVWAVMKAAGEIERMLRLSLSARS